MLVYMLFMMLDCLVKSEYAEAKAWFFASVWCIVSLFMYTHPQVMIEIKIVTHYGTDDLSCNGDYYQIQIFMNTGMGEKLVQTYGDQYHDKGADKERGFIDGVKALTDDYTIEYVDISDYEV